MRGRPSFNEQRLAWAAFWEKPFGPRDGRINWRGPHCWMFVLFLVCLGISLIPVRPVYLSVVPHAHALAAGVFLLVLLFRRVIQSHIAAIEEFLPQDPAEAKRANEQIKLIAAFLNSSAVGIVAVVAIKEMFEDSPPSYAVIIVALALAYWVHVHARSMLGLLKDESQA